MVHSILIASSNSAFSELIRLSLEESGNFRLRVAQSTLEILSSLSRAPCHLVIIDSEIEGEPLKDFIRSLNDQLPELKLIVFPPDNRPDHPSIQGIRVDAFLSKPFYLPDLLTTVEKLLSDVGLDSEMKFLDFASAELSSRASEKTPASSNKPSWIDNRGLANQILESLLMDSSAQAGMLIRDKAVWISAGRMTDRSANELNALLSKYWESVLKTDLIRFARLESLNGEFLNYATPIYDDLILVLVFDISMPISRIRFQTMRIVNTLRNYTGKAEPVLNGLTSFDPTISQVSMPSFKKFEPALQLPDEPPPAPDAEPENIRLSQLLNKTAPPPSKPQPAEEIKSEWNFEQYLEENKHLFPWEKDAENEIKPMLPAEPPAPPPVSPVSPAHAPASARATEETMPSKAFPAEAVFQGYPESDFSAQETVPVQRPPDAQTAPDEMTHPPMPRVDVPPPPFEPDTMNMVNLRYTCLLIPRFPQHYLAGELADYISMWVPQLCLAFGWRLERIAVRPEFLQWTLAVPPAVAPNSLIRLMSRQLSKRIFEKYASFSIDNPSGDFWAPGFLIISGYQPPNRSVIREFIQQTRSRQGIGIQ